MFYLLLGMFPDWPISTAFFLLNLSCQCKMLQIQQINQKSWPKRISFIVNQQYPGEGNVLKARKYYICIKYLYRYQIFRSNSKNMIILILAFSRSCFFYMNEIYDHFSLKKCSCKQFKQNLSTNSPAMFEVNQLKREQFFRVPGDYRPHKSTYTHLGGPLAKLGQLVRPGLDPATPTSGKQADGFSHLLHSVLRLGSCQWNWVVAGATAAPWMVPDGTSQAPNPM